MSGNDREAIVTLLVEKGLTRRPDIWNSAGRRSPMQPRAGARLLSS